MQTTTRKTVLNVTFIALFAALCFAAIAYIPKIPIGPMFIHVGNMIVVLAALLIGGWQGGLAGSIGMGLADLLDPIYIVAAPKTVLLKFLMGFTVGFLFRLIKKREKYPAFPLLLGGIVCSLACGGLLVHMIEVNHAYAGKSAVLFPLFVILGILCFLFSGLQDRFPHKTAAAIIGATAGVLVNLVGETAWAFLSLLLAGSTVQAAFSAAAVAQAATLINAIVAVIGGVALFTALEKPVRKILGE